MPMPSAYETRSEAFFRLYEGETPQERFKRSSPDGYPREAAF